MKHDQEGRARCTRRGGLRRLLLRAVVASALGGLGLFAGAPTRAEDGHASSSRAVVESVVQSFVRAWNEHDIDTLAQLFTSGGNFTSPAGEGARTRAGIRKLLAREHRDIFRESTLTANTTGIEFPSAGHAVATGTYTLSDIPVMFGIEVAREGHFRFELERRQGGWRITSARIARD